MFDASLPRHQAFWSLQPQDRPLLGSIIGMFAHERYPKTTAALPAGRIEPDDLHLEPFLEDCERQFALHRELGDDYPFTGSPYKFIPWMEAIIGCPVVAGDTSMWAEPFADSWQQWPEQAPSPDNPWVLKLLEQMNALAEISRGRFPVSATLLRGPLDMVAAARGAAQFPLDAVDTPQLVRKAAQQCAAIRLEVARALQRLIPESADGYMDGDNGLRYWSPTRPMWLQEDAIAFLSPRLYRDLFYDIDRWFAGHFDSLAFHLHGVSHWAVDLLVAAPEIHVMQVGFDEGASPEEAERIFRACRSIQGVKPLIIQKNYDDDFWPWLDRVLGEFPWRGLAVQTTVSDIAEGMDLKRRFLEACASRESPAIH